MPMASAAFVRAVVCILRKFMYVNSATKKKIQATSGTAGRMFIAALAHHTVQISGFST